MLKDLKQSAHPDYVVTVLNQPSGFIVEPGSTLADMEAALSNKAYSSGFKNEHDKFVMATTSYKGAGTYYFATKLEPANFTQTYPTPVDLEPADIYVERLACRANLVVTENSEEDPNGITYDETSKSFVKRLSVTVAGNLNANDTEDPNLIAAKYVYVHLYGWGLNATSKNSRMVKTIDPNWDDSSLFTNWNIDGDHRSFWGKSFNYDAPNALYPGTDDDGEYDQNSTTNTKIKWDAAWVPGAEEAVGYPLKYVSYDAVETYATKGKTYSLYCSENTNTGDIVSDNGSAITSVVIQAKVTDEDGTGLDLVRYRGVLYTYDNYKKNMINRLKLDGNLNYYICTNPDADEGVDRNYEQIGVEKLKLEDYGNGEVILTPNFKISGEGAINVYKYDATENDFVLIDETDYVKLQSDLIALNYAQSGYQAIGYNGGMMYYNIPIEHLATNTSEESGTVSEAVYGVVRNHSYVITVQNIANLGHGVFDPDKKIIISDPTPDQKLWSVGATIKILSWKIVNQSVNL